ncbi:endonuclease [Rhodobacterales bacterium HKCCE3408]|nr:endonuclease [Rhodobacterales bacterium HKCCE3408]
MLLRIAGGLIGVLVLAALAVLVQDWRMGRANSLGPVPEGAVRIATHNVHYIVLNAEEGRWSVGDWEERRNALDLAFKTLDADIVAFQEMESFARGSDGSVNLARDWLLEHNPGYAAAASGDWREFPSTQPILYRTDRMELVDQGWFFFSDTPDVIYSRTFNGSYPAFTSWAQFRLNDGGLLRVVNLHTDYASRDNRRQSLALVAERIAPWMAAGEAVVVLGDFNALRSSRLIDPIEAQGVSFLRVRGATVHFDRGIDILPPIDLIGHSDALSAIGPPRVLRERYDGVWPSDHYPVVADFRLSP